MGRAVPELPPVDHRARRLALVRERVLAVEIEVRDDHRRFDVLALARTVPGKETEHQRRGVPRSGNGICTVLTQRPVALTRLVRGLAAKAASTGSMAG